MTSAPEGTGAARSETSGDSGAGQHAVGVIVARQGRLPVGADETVGAAGGSVVVIGPGAEAAAEEICDPTARTAIPVRWADTGLAFRPGCLAEALAPVVEPFPLVVLPASPDGRDLAPRLAAVLERPLVARAVLAKSRAGGGVHALAARLDDRILVPIDITGPAVVTVVGATGSRAIRGTRQAGSPAGTTKISPIDLELGTGSSSGRTHVHDAELVGLLEPDLHTMDLADASRVFSGGAGLARGLDDAQATRIFDLLGEVAAALGGSAGATRVATDAGWAGYQRQIGTTGVTLDPELYVAFGVSGASQHVGGIGSPDHIVSVNVDPSAPMTAMADLGIVTDARRLVVALADRLGIDVPPGLEDDRESTRG
ncbi:MAG: mycofactocin-associated electron transfer flavoprotein alpha subunit [Acidimicrobiales bacterium]